MLTKYLLHSPGSQQTTPSCELAAEPAGTSVGSAGYVLLLYPLFLHKY